MKETYYSQNRTEMLKYVPKECNTVLEIGCGKGNFALLCKEKTGAYTIGIEYNPEAGKIAKQKIDKVYIGDVFTEINNIENHSIDLVIFNDVLEHLTYPDKLLIMLCEKMTNKGQILASLPNFRYFSNLKHILWDKDFNYESTGVRDYTHFRFFTRKSIINLFSRLNFKIIDIEGINPFPLINYKQWIKLFILKIMLQDDTRFKQYAILCSFPQNNKKNNLRTSPQ